MVASEFLARSARASVMTSSTDLMAGALDRTNRLAASALMYDETLIVDDRSGMSPAQMVENRLTQKLGAGMLPVSQLQTRTLLRGR